MDSPKSEEKEEGKIIGRDVFVEGLVCWVCQKLMKDHRVLPCGHAFCSGCLTELPQHQEEFEGENKKVKKRLCPIDDVPFDFTKLSQIDVLTNLLEANSDFSPPNLDSPLCEECENALGDLWCQDCAGFYCRECQEKTHIGRKMKTHRLLTVIERVREERKGKFEKCGVHQQEEMLYCSDCAVSICILCHVDDHSGHQTKSVLKRGTERRSQLHDVVGTNMEKFDYLTVYKTDLETCIQEKKALIIEKEEELERLRKSLLGFEGEFANVKESCLKVDMAQCFFDGMVKGLPLDHASDSEVSLAQDRLEDSFGTLKDSLPPETLIDIKIKVWGAGGSGSSKNEGHHGSFVKWLFDLSLGDELTVVVGQGGTTGLKRRGKGGYKTNGGFSSKAGCGGGSSHVFSKRIGEILVTAGGGAGGSTRSYLGGGGGGTYLGTVGQGEGDKQYKSNGGGGMGCDGERSYYVGGKYYRPGEKDGREDEDWEGFGEGGEVEEEGGDGGVVLRLKEGGEKMVFKEVGEHHVLVRDLVGSGLFCSEEEEVEEEEEEEEEEVEEEEDIAF